MGNNKKAKSGKAEGARCRRHRQQQQQGAGVCASCLRDRLSHLSLSASSLPSVVVRGGEEEAKGYRYSRYHDEDEALSSCGSEASTAYSSEGSSAASSECASPAGGDDETRRAARVSLLMRHERVVGDADAVAAFLRARREQRRTAGMSFWAKLLHVTTTRGGGKKDQGCSLAARGGKTLEERAAAAKWVLF